MVLLVKLVREISLKRSGMKHFSSLYMNVLHHVDKKAVCSMSDLKFGRTSNSNNLTVFTAAIKLSAFADDFVKQSAKQF